MIPLRLILVLLFSFSNIQRDAQMDRLDYLDYHKAIFEAEKMLSEGRYADAFVQYEQILTKGEFSFVRDIKIATQLAAFLNDIPKAFDLLERGIAAGWELKDIQRNKALKPLLQHPNWKTIKESYEEVRKQYSTRIDWDLREEIRQMYRLDQKKAMGALTRIGQKAKEKYTHTVFAPHSEFQMRKLIDLISKNGYPGEKRIGNDTWVSTIVSHHVSISSDYSKKDTLYTFIKPKLFKALRNGEISPYEYALIDDWYIAVSSDRSERGYGFLTPPKASTLSQTNSLREDIGLRTIEMRNNLVAEEEKTGMAFYLPNWVRGKINIE